MLFKSDIEIIVRRTQRGGSECDVTIALFSSERCTDIFIIIDDIQLDYLALVQQPGLPTFLTGEEYEHRM